MGSVEKTNANTTQSMRDDLLRLEAVATRQAVMMSSRSYPSPAIAMAAQSIVTEFLAAVDAARLALDMARDDDDLSRAVAVVAEQCQRAGDMMSAITVQVAEPETDALH